MNRVRLLVVLFLVALAGFVIVRMPLVFGLQMSGASQAGLSWQAASGTVWSGRLSGVSYAGRQPLGDVALRAKPPALLTGGVGYGFDWEGSAGQGTGDVIVGRRGVRVSGLDLDVRLAGLVGLDADLRNTEGRVYVRGADVVFRDGACSRATGDISSDVLERFALRYNVPATELTGGLTCEADALRLSMRGQLGQEDLVLVDGRVGASGAARFEIRVETDDPAIGVGLLGYGFVEDAIGYIYQGRAVFPGGF